MENLPLTEFDLATSGTYMQMIKAYIPFIDLKEQKFISIAIRIAELIQTINFLKICQNRPRYFVPITTGSIL